MELPRTVLFLCPHNAAKSVLAAAYFDQQASSRGLPFRANSAGTEPDDQPSPAVVAALRDEGIDVAGHQPRFVTAEELTTAHRVISLGCDPNDLPRADVRIERWGDVPPVSQDLDRARSTIQRHLEILVDELAAETPRSPTRA